MRRYRNCWEPEHSSDAAADSFCGSLKKERKRIYTTRNLARADIVDYIEVFYNCTRRHNCLDYVSPEAFARAAM
jgi:putative transposase